MIKLIAGGAIIAASLLGFTHTALSKVPPNPKPRPTTPPVAESHPNAAETMTPMAMCLTMNGALAPFQNAVDMFTANQHYRVTATYLSYGQIPTVVMTAPDGDVLILFAGDKGQACITSIGKGWILNEEKKPTY